MTKNQINDLMKKNKKYCYADIYIKNVDSFISY